MVRAFAGDSTITNLPDLLFLPAEDAFDRFLVLRPAFCLDSAVGFGSVSCAAVRPLLYMLVPQTGQTPRVAGEPLAAHSAWGFSIIRFSLHLTQYASSSIKLRLTILVQLCAYKTVNQLLDQSYIILVYDEDGVGRVNHDHALQTSNCQQFSFFIVVQ
jgi:hypothetical protein